MTCARYVHGYSPRESVRLGDQAQTLADLLHGDERYPSGALVLEAGCGTGAQTVILTRKNPTAQFVSVDIAPESLEQARRAARRVGANNVRFEQADLLQLPYSNGMFDAVFVCFVLEHLSAPLRALTELGRVLRPGGTVTVIEGDHGSAYFHPESALARKAIQCLVDLQKQAGGDALIGRRLYPVLCEAGFTRVRVTPRVVYADASRPEMVEGFTRNTFNAMVEGIAETVLRTGMMDARSWQQGIADLHRTADPDGVFNYTFFRARAQKAV
jgi:ubiquinone/menaquinone biosynthesis C-methylase UbiE